MSLQVERSEMTLLQEFGIVHFFVMAVNIFLHLLMLVLL